MVTRAFFLFYREFFGFFVLFLGLCLYYVFVVLSVGGRL